MWHGQGAAYVELKLSRLVSAFMGKTNNLSSLEGLFQSHTFPSEGRAGRS